MLTVHNSFLQVTVSALGAELQSVKTADGCEYLWQGEAKYWSGRAPVLFPFIGRLEGGRYLAEGSEYAMGIHGFAAKSEFAVTLHTDTVLSLNLRSSERTRAGYPYDFSFDLTYRLEGSTLAVEQRVVNEGGRPMHFALGGHPGFRVPLEAGEAFADYRLEFSQKCSPDRILFTPDSVLVSGQTEPFPLENGTSLPLEHTLFCKDAIILQNMARQVTLKSEKSRRFVTVTYPDMPYLGFWHWPNTDAPYVCIEPWSSLPGRANTAEEIACRSDFIHLAPGRSYENTWTVCIGGK